MKKIWARPKPKHLQTTILSLLTSWLLSLIGWKTLEAFDWGFLSRTESGRSLMPNSKKYLTEIAVEYTVHVKHLGFFTSDVLNFIRTKMSLNKKRKISAMACIRLGIPVEDGKWIRYLPFSLQFNWPLLEPEAYMLVM